ncbi:MAG TPA: prolyl oligopeptidase family serine peptidase [Fibrobacteria bacterium]|nr:prolyl oligopeptidase family serine peptidase [Fibrobacteria bacterium]
MRPLSPLSAKFSAILMGTFLGAQVAWAVEEVGYRKPPREMLEVLHAPEPPDGSLSPANNAMMLMTPVRFPPIAELAQPWLSLAGTRVAPRNRSIGEVYQNGETYWSGYTQLDLASGKTTAVDLPVPAKVGSPVWSADGRRYAFARIAERSIELWLGEMGSAKVRRVEGVALNRMLGDAILWMPDQKTLLVKAVADSQGEPPATDGPPVGPGVQETSGEGSASSTYEAMSVLRTPADEKAFEYFALAQPKLVDFATGNVTLWGRPDLYADLSVSPDGSLVLAEVVHRPFSHATAWDRFPRRIEVRDRKGAMVRQVVDLPMAESVPIGGVPSGPRDVRWRPTAPATLVWTEALDGGDLGVKVPRRDRLMAWEFPFSAKPRAFASTEHRLWSLDFFAKDGGILVVEFDPIRHWTRSWIHNADRPAKPRLIRDISSDERYADPGLPLMQVRPDGTSVLLQDGDHLFLRGLGSTPRGDRPFLDMLDLGTLKAKRLFRCDTASYEYPFAILDLPGRRFLTRRESLRDPPDFFARFLGKPMAASPGEADWTSDTIRLTRTEDPTPILRQVEKRLVTYKRDDGLELSFKLHLPPGYQEGRKLPAVMNAYPLDYTEARTAGQVAGSTRRFARLGRSSQLYFLLAGYAVMDEVQMPVVGNARRMYDTYLEQILSDARAALAAADRTGAVDTRRVGVMGHSHGGLMVANLLAHSRLFKAGIARSGGYNKTLTAFGFQREERTLWQAPQVYTQVSPLFAADSIRDPLLLIHGEADANPGTLPIQSEHLYQAIRGNGGTARLVMLPLEAHGYRAMESNEHVLREQLDWFDRYVKGR